MLEASEIEKMSVTERLRAIEQLWESVSRSESDVPSPEWHGEVISERKRRAKTGEARFLTLQELKARMRAMQA